MLQDQLDKQIIKSIINKAMAMEAANLQKAQDKRIQPMEMLRRQIEMLKNELKGEKEKLS